MREVAREHQDQLEKIKKNIKHMIDANSENIERAARFKKMIFKKTLSDATENALDYVGKPKLQFNIAEAFLGRLCGEFSKNEPDIMLGINDETKVTQQTEMQKEVLEGHLRYVMHNMKKNGIEYDVFHDLVAGGFGSLKVYPDYKHPKTFQQEIKIKKSFDASMVAFDLLAREPSKKDARWAVELFPKSKEEVEEQYDVDLEKVKFTENDSGFDWFYMQGEEKILIMANYVETKKKRVKLYEVIYQDNNTGETVTKEMLKDEYDEFRDEWVRSNRIEMIPEPAQERMTMLESVEQYILIGNKVLEHETLACSYIPYVNFSNSEFFSVRGKNTEEMTRPYLYNIEGAQRLYDQIGITLADECQNLSRQKMIFPWEGVVDVKYIEAPQKYDILPYRSYDRNDPTKQIPPPSPIPRAAFPPEMFALFQYIPDLFQNILGSNDQRMDNKQLSGAAIVQGQIQTSSASMPLITKFLQSYTRVAELVIDLIPKICVEPMSLPIIDKEGSMKMQKINQGYTDENRMWKKVDMDYSPEAFTVKVEAGTSFSAQKTQAMQTLIQLSQAMPGFAQFMNTAGLKVLIDNLDIKGADLLKLMVDSYMQQQQQAQQQQQQMAAQNDPNVMKAKTEQQRLQLEGAKMQQESVFRNAELSISKQDADTNRIKAITDAQNKHMDSLANIGRNDAENTRSAVEMTMAIARHQHEQARDVHQHMHQRDMDHGELAHKIASTILEHQRHEASESRAQETAEHQE